MKSIKRVLKWVGKIGLALVILLVGILSFVIYKPEILINEKNLKLAVPPLARFGYHLDWAKANLSIESKSFLEKHLVMQFEKLCVDAGSIEVMGCFNIINLGFIIDFDNMKFHVLDAGPIEVETQKLMIDLKPSQEKKSKPGMFSEIFTNRTQFHDINIHAQDLNYKTNSSIYKIDISVSDHDSLKSEGAWILSGKISARDVTDQTKVSGSFKLNGNKSLLSLPKSLIANLEAAVGGTMKVSSQLEYKFADKTSGDYKINLKLNSGKKLDLDGQIVGKIDTQSTMGHLFAEIKTGGFNIPIGPKRTCQYQISFSEKIDLDCPFQVLVHPNFLKGIDIAKDFSKVHFALVIHLLSKNGLSSEGLWNGKIAFEAKTQTPASVRINGEIKSEFSDSPLTAEVLKNLKAQASTHVQVVDFTALTERLNSTPFAIPAPLNVLGGTLECFLKDSFALSDLKIPFECHSNLKSENEAVKFSAQGSFSLFEKMKKYIPRLDLKVTLEDIQLALPHFGLKGPPPLFADSRIKKSLAESSDQEPSFFEYRVEAATIPNKPIRFLSNIAMNPIPVELDVLHASHKPVMGAVHIKNFSAKLFRREAQIKYFDLKINSEDRIEGKENIHGLVEVHFTDYLIKININGTTKEPLLQFESVPPLSQDDIIAVLLFGHPANDMSPDHASSVANTQAALADKALGLTSMYLLASTPIESIGYNSQSQTFTAKFRLAEGTSLNVGAGDVGVKEVGINRHLGGPWYIYTAVKNASEGHDQSTATFLEWVLRY